MQTEAISAAARSWPEELRLHKQQGERGGVGRGHSGNEGPIFQICVIAHFHSEHEVFAPK